MATSAGACRAAAAAARRARRPCWQQRRAGGAQAAGARAGAAAATQRRQAASSGVALRSADDRWDWPGPELPVSSADDRWHLQEPPAADVALGAPEPDLVPPWLNPKDLSHYEGMNVGQVLEAKLREFGVTHVFGYTGGAVLPVTDAFHGSPITFVNNASEQCCGHSAEGYAKAGGGLSTGVVMATSGPGVTNLVTPLQDAITDSVPLVAFVGQVPTAAVGTDAFQECPTCAITAPCTKWNYQLKSASEFPSVVDEAFRVAHEGKKGPVLIDLPKDVSLQTVSTEQPTERVVATGARVWAEHRRGVPVADPRDVLRASDLVNRAERPVIVAGNGALHASQELRAMSAKCGIPLATTLHGLGIGDEDSELCLGMLGMHGAAYANYIVQQSDLVIGIGYRFDDRTTGNLKLYAPEAHRAAREGRGGFLHIEIEPKQVDRIVPATASVIGDSRAVLREMLPQLTPTRRSLWRQTVAKLKEATPFTYIPPEDASRFKLQQVLCEMQMYLAETGRDKNTMWTTGVGNHQMMACQFVQWRWPRRMITSGSLGTMGVGLPFAIGAAIRRPDLTVIDVDGDGSFNMTSNDLRTVAAHNLPVKIAVMNDERQQMVHIWQTLYFNGRYVVTQNHNPDYVKLAEAHGIHGMRCETAGELAPAVREFIDRDGPVLCEFRIEPDMCTPMVAPGAALDDMILDPSDVMRLDANPSLVPG
eukprot:TRINITY_DN4406_c0_g2_i1.p1 TRINITY_DN4406_c0_g2~~TRINITY_DN4406_c0_g2_i1.p1  ORF type:complete len:731 (+),score=216.36 TRINITY_DN4406_c0_g2_i1:81-2195(+)